MNFLPDKFSSFSLLSSPPLAVAAVQDVFLLLSRLFVRLTAPPGGSRKAELGLFIGECKHDFDCRVRGQAWCDSCSEIMPRGQLSACGSSFWPQKDGLRPLSPACSSELNLRAFRLTEAGKRLNEGQSRLDKT